MSDVATVIIVLLIFNALLLTCILTGRLKGDPSTDRHHSRTNETEKKKGVKKEPNESMEASAFESGIDDINIQLSLSQIGPHFIFNCLNTIYYLVEKDPEAAQAAINEFSVYLRGNIDSFGRKEPILFSEEMEHVKHYLTLEKLRYGDELTVILDIHTRDFLIPALSLQALAENAVHHGISKKEEGGSLYIQAWEGKDTFSVVVRDDGVGFDPGYQKNDGKTHTGIKNVGELVKVLCNGSLEIMSEKGVGTTAIISIPKQTDDPVDSLLDGKF